MNHSAKLFLPLLAVLALAAAAAPALAGTNFWSPIGPDGAQVTALAVSPIQPLELFAAPQRGGIYKSSDGGATWGLLGRGTGTEVIVALAADPHRYGTAYAAGGSGAVFKTIDGGGNWVRVWAGPPDNGIIVDTFTLLPDPRRRDVLYAGARNGLFRSTDGGATWARRSNPGPVRALASDAAGGWLYAAVDGQGVFRSFNQGKSWERASTGLPASFFLSLAVDPERSRTLFVTTPQGLYRSFDRGGRWQRVTGLPDNSATGIAFQGQGRVYASFLSGIFFSPDSGATWRRTANLPGRNGGDLRLAAGPDAAYAGVLGDPDGPGLYRTLDDGATWQPAVRGLQGLAVTDVAVATPDGRTIYAAVGLNRLFKTVDGGATWSRISSGVFGGFYPIGDILVDPARPETVWVVSEIHPPVQRSDDGGVSWRATGGTDLSLRGVAFDPRAPEALWAAGWRGVFHSADGGLTWEHRGPGIEGMFYLEEVQVDPHDPDVIYAAGSQVAGIRPVLFSPALFRSGDGGATWERRDAGILGGSVTDLAVDTTDPATLYATTFQLYRSTDSGLTWTPVPGAGLSHVTVAAVPAGPGIPAAVYTARQFPAPTVLRSTDQRETWRPLRFNLAPAIPRVLEVDPTNPAHLLLGTENRSLLSYTVGAAQ